MKDLLYVNIRRRSYEERFQCEHDHYSPWVVESEVWTCEYCNRPKTYTFITEVFMIPMFDCKCYLCIDRVFYNSPCKCQVVKIEYGECDYFDWHEYYLAEERYKEIQAKEARREQSS